MDKAVSQKLAYLQSDEVFTDGIEEETPQNDDSLLSAFAMPSQPASVLQYQQQPSAREVITNNKPEYRPRYIENAPTEQSIEDHKQNIAAKIAALRGISMPGDYLRNKK